MFLEVTGGEELYRVKKTEGERRMKEQPSPANADEQGIVKGEGHFLEMIILVYRRKVMSVTTTP